MLLSVAQEAAPVIDQMLHSCGRSVGCRTKWGEEKAEMLKLSTTLSMKIGSALTLAEVFTERFKQLCGQGKSADFA